VRDLADAGFRRTEGIDPVLPEDVVAQLPGNIHKAALDDVDGEYDVVMLHHVLEHMPDQDEALRQVARVLRPAGYCLIRLPVMPNEAWRRYRENWVQLDAPRHLFIHSEKSLELVASRAGLRIEHVEYDSTEFQFVGSEQYMRNVPLNQPHGVAPADVRRFRREARRLNRIRQGDQAAFYLRKSPRQNA
jgi:SAM-dependent methyltransferase